MNIEILKVIRQNAKIAELFSCGKSAFTDEKYTCERIHTSVGHLQMLNILEIWLIITKKHVNVVQF